jgi:hypothetical protein
VSAFLNNLLILVGCLIVAGATLWKMWTELVELLVPENADNSEEGDNYR